MGISFGVASLAAWFAYDSYINVPERPKAIAARLGKVYELVSNKYFVDEFYFAKIINPLVNGSKGLWLYIDVNFIDKGTYLLADFVKTCSSGFKALQNGNMQQYAMYVAIGIVATITFVLVG